MHLVSNIDNHVSRRTEAVVDRPNVDPQTDCLNDFTAQYFALFFCFLLFALLPLYHVMVNKGISIFVCPSVCDAPVSCQNG